MNEQAIAIFCICDEVAKFFGLKDHPQCKMTTFSVSVSKILRSIKARTEKGFLLKTVLFILAFLVERYCPVN